MAVWLVEHEKRVTKLPNRTTACAHKIIICRKIDSSHSGKFKRLQTKNSLTHTLTQAHLACIHTYAPLIFVSTFLSHTHTLAHRIRLAWLCVLHNCRHIVFCALTFLALEFQIIFPFTFALNSFSKFHRKRTQRAVTVARHTTIQFVFLHLTFSWIQIYSATHT